MSVKKEHNLKTWTELNGEQQGMALQNAFKLGLHPFVDLDLLYKITKDVYDKYGVIIQADRLVKDQIELHNSIHGEPTTEQIIIELHKDCWLFDEEGRIYKT